MEGMKGMQGGMPMQKDMPMEGAPKGEALHAGTGVVKSIDPAKGTVTLAHEPIKSIGWGKMAMGFKLKETKLAEGIKAGDRVRFEFVQDGGEYVVQRLEKR